MLKKQAPIAIENTFPEFIENNPYFLLFPAKNMTVVVTRKPTYILPGSYAHLACEFFLALKPIVGQTIDGKPIAVPKGYICPLNSTQPHGAQALISNAAFISIQFDPDYFRKLCILYGQKAYGFSNTLIAYDDELRNLMHTFFREYRKNDACTPITLKSLETQLAVSLIRRLRFDDAYTRAEQKEESIDHIIDYVQDNYEDGFSLDDVSERTHMNKYSLIRKFKAHTGMTPYEFHLDTRLRRALELLEDLQMKVIDVAVLCGFKNHSHFSRMFKQKLGMTPTEYRKSIS